MKWLGLSKGHDRQRGVLNLIYDLREDASLAYALVRQFMPSLLFPFGVIVVQKLPYT